MLHFLPRQTAHVIQFLLRLLLLRDQLLVQALNLLMLRLDVGVEKLDRFIRVLIGFIQLVS